MVGSQPLTTTLGKIYMLVNRLRVFDFLLLFSLFISWYNGVKSRNGKCRFRNQNWDFDKRSPTQML